MPKTAEILEIPATITERGQTTVPAAIRKMLASASVTGWCSVVWRTGRSSWQRRDAAEKPILSSARSWLFSPGTWRRRLRGEPCLDLVTRGNGLVEGVEVDLDAPLPEDEG